MKIRDYINWSKIVLLRKTKAPPITHIEIETSTKCNLRCIMCRMMERSKISKNQLLAYEDACYIYDSIKASHTTLCHNGEPFMNPDIFRIINYIHNKGSWTSVTTNLNVLPGKPKDIIKCGLDVLKISIDAATPETYNRIRKGGDFDSLIETIKLILHEKKRAAKTKPILRLGFVIQEQNYQEIDLFAEMTAKLGIDTIRYYQMNPMIEDQLPILFDLSVLSEKLRHTKKIASGNGLKTNINSISIEPFKIYSKLTKHNWQSFPLLYKEMMKEQNKECYCIQPWLASNILIDGTVSPCCTLAPPDESRIELGNVFHQSWNDIWNGEMYTSFRSSIKSGLSEPCINKCREPRTFANLFMFLKKVLPFN